MTRRRRLLLTADAVGGVWTYALDLAAAMEPLGFDTTLAVLGPEPDALQLADAGAIPGLDIAVTGLPLDWTAERADDLAEAAAALADLAQRQKVDTVQLHTPALAIAEFTQPVVAVTHSCLGTWWRSMRPGEPMPADFAWRSDAVRRGLAAAQAVVAPSGAFAALTAEVYGLRSPPAVVHNGRRLMPVPGRPEPAEYVLSAGRLWDEAKNAAVLDAAAGLATVPVLAAGAVAGPDGKAVSFRHLRSLGALDPAALAALMAGRPVFASLSRYEPFGLAVLEAAQAGCALVLSDIPTFRELWDGAARFVAPGDPSQAARAFEAILGDGEARRALGAAARARAARFTPEAMAGGMAAIHGSLTGIASRTARRSAA